MCHSPLKDFFAKYLSEPLPIESTLPHYLHEHLITEIASGEVKSIQESLDWITWTFMYRRLAKNPNYYEIAGLSSQHINDYLSELVEDTIADLVETGSVEQADPDGEDIDIANLGKISSHYCLSFLTLQLYAKAFPSEGKNDSGPSTQIKLAKILEVLCQTQELSSCVQNIDVDELEMRKLALNLPIDVDRREDFCSPHIICNILLQCHISRRSLSSDVLALLKPIQQ